VTVFMLATLNMLADTGATYWQPVQASRVGGEIDWLFNFIMAICIFFFLLILFLLVLFGWLYRYREGYDPGEAPKHSTALELTWTFVPTVIMVVIFYYGFKDFMHMSVVPPNSYEIVVSARMWSYTFRYPNGHVDNVLHIPANTPVSFVLSSDDVIHGFYIPAFRVKKDDVPGRYNKIWVVATVAGTYDIYCTQFCGQDHSKMRAQCIVQDPDEFRGWLKNADANLGSPADRGKHIWETRGCNQCHTIDGSANRGPTWKDVFGSKITFKDGTTLVADENYLHGVITTPNSKPIPGFDPIMPPTAGLLTDKDVDNVIAFLKSDSSHYKPDPFSATTTKPSPAATPAQ
jgi:cytochrome c oxidase subunit II